MLDKNLRLFGCEFPAAGHTVKTNFAVKMHLSTPALGADYILICRIKHSSIRPPSYHKTNLICSKYFIGEIQADIKL
jgi:hypothetical protein